MIKGLRQVAVISDDLDASLDLYRGVLGMEVCDSLDLSEYSLKNALLPAGNGTFIEILEPTDTKCTAARFLQNKGQGMYLITFEAEDLGGLRNHLNSVGIPVTKEVQWNGYRSMFVHPASLNGVLIELSETAAGPNPWSPAGDTWYRSNWNPITRQIRQVAVLVEHLDSAIPIWEIAFNRKFTQRFYIPFTELEIAVMPLGDGQTFIELAQPTELQSSASRFLQRRGEGLYLLIFEVDDVAGTEEHLKVRDVQITTARDAFSQAEQMLPSDGIRSVWIHPNSMRGVFAQLSEVLSLDNPWPPAGDSWHRLQQRSV